MFILIGVWLIGHLVGEPGGIEPTPLQNLFVRTVGEFRSLG
jgi:hypothetical protein